jgi:signal transduction histidine kinase
MRWLPIRWRLTLFHTVTMLVVVLGLIMAMFAVLGWEQNERLKDRASDCAWIAESFLSQTGTLDDRGLDELGCQGMSFYALDGEGRILVESGVSIGVDQVFPDDFWRESLESGDPEQEHRVLDFGGDEESNFGYAIPVRVQDPPVRIVVATLQYSTLGGDLIFIIPTVIAGVAILALIVIGVTSYFLLRSSLAPVNAIASAAREISGSDLSRRLPVETPRDELGQLSMTINDLLARLEVAFREREQALEEQRRFVADASHELRTPLTSILGYTRMLRQWGLEHPEAAKEGIDALEQEAGRMHRLVESLLRLARGEELPAMNRTVHDLGAVISDAVEAAKAFGGGQQEIVVTLPEQPVRATVDRGMLLQVIEILLDNAVKYAGSTESIEVSLHADGGNAVIRVIDHGPGIAPEHLPNLFERFYRAEQSRTTRGSGLGLAIAKQIVEQHNGIIDVDSTLGEGTTFTITLPVASFNV